MRNGSTHILRHLPLSGKSRLLGRALVNVLIFFQDGPESASWLSRCSQRWASLPMGKRIEASGVGVVARNLG